MKSGTWPVSQGHSCVLWVLPSTSGGMYLCETVGGRPLSGQASRLSCADIYPGFSVPLGHSLQFTFVWCYYTRFRFFSQVSVLHIKQGEANFFLESAR